MKSFSIGTLGRFALVLSALVISGPAFAQATRTWVSGVGDDANPCSRTAPCKTWAGAISKTATGGEINAIDSGGFGAVTITKSITLDGAGVHASTLSSSTNGIVINAPADAVVNLRNIAINGAPPTSSGLTGIKFLAGGTLNIENVVVIGFREWGLQFLPAGSAELSIVNSTFANNNTSGGGGILIKPPAGISANASLDGVRIVNNILGLRSESRTSVTVRDSTISGNTNTGVLVLAPLTPATVAIDSSLVSGNGVGLRAQGAEAELIIGNNTVSANGVGLSPLDNGTIVSFGNNDVRGNGTDGQPDVTVVTR